MKRYCAPCDTWVTGKECPACGADTDAPESNPRESRDDDGVEYADPRDEREERREG
jgi:hypothetical protein